MPRSLLRGDYNLLMAIESSSRANSWYRVLVDRQSRLLSCDCPPWTFNRNQDANGHRFCPHTVTAERLIAANQTAAGTSQHFTPATLASQLLVAAQEQWPGLRGIWSIEERDANIGTKSYHFVLLRLELGNGGTATGVVAFANAHHHSVNEMIPGVAGWAGYAIAAEVARLAGHPFMGQVPEHFRIDRRSTERRRAQPERPSAATQHIGLEDILRVGDIVNLGDGLTPKQRAANTLRFFIGEETYSQVERQGFLDVSSAKHSGRVYRMRRDPDRERRVRVMEESVYRSDYCIVSSQDVPPDDLFLTVMLGLMSDEDALLAVVNPHFNIFPPNSDGRERETIPAVWHPRATVA
jgi:hypothetical protein